MYPYEFGYGFRPLSERVRVFRVGVRVATFQPGPGPVPNTKSDLLLYVAESVMAASLLLEEDSDDADLLGIDEEEAEFLSDDISEVLGLTALNSAEIAQYMSGDGSRGTYDQIPKSKDFFSICLRAPDCEFRHMFRIGRALFDYLVGELTLNPIFHSTGRRPQRHVKY
ncbi:DDE Tnp4 domain-containing protein [Mycena venus]|uniref:DDE Tnp4 domain-containing protein n=1 Tax=Mycena venus TaxID=2733690 RepID=A0A8H7DE11_9AGAR|nr:DDE Tnp4 domain-containing protein [Mycena venus]